MPFASLYHVVSFPVGEQFLKPVGPRMSTAVHGFLYVEVSNQGLVAKIKLAKSPPRGAGLGLGMVAVMIQQVFYGIPMYSNVIIPHDSTEHNMFDIVRLFKHVQRMFKGCSKDVQRMFRGCSNTFFGFFFIFFHRCSASHFELLHVTSLLALLQVSMLGCHDFSRNLTDFMNSEPSFDLIRVIKCY